MFLLNVLLVFLVGRVAGFNGATDRRIRLCLLEALKRFHLGHAPLKAASVPSSSDSTNDPRFYSFPFDLKYQSVMPFLDSKSLIRLSAVNRDFYSLYNHAVYARLSKLHPHFFTSDPAVNGLLFALLSQSSLSSPSFQDELELLILKFNFGAEPINEVIPRNIVYYLLCFMNEITHGLDSPVPTNKDNGRVHFIRQLRRNYLPLSLEYFVREGLDPIWADFAQFWLNSVNFFSTRPKSESMKEFYNIESVNFIKIVSLQVKIPEFIVAVLESLVDEIREADFDFVMRYLCSYNSFSKRLFYKKLYWNQGGGSQVAGGDSRYYLETYIRGGRQADNVYAIFAFDSLTTGVSIDLGFINPVRNAAWFFITFIDCQCSSLATLEVFSQIINTVAITPEPHYMNKFLHYSIVYYNLQILEVIIKESSMPMNMVYYDDYFTSIFYSGFGFKHLARTDLLKAFADFIVLKDPFAFLFMKEEVLLAFKPFIQDKFELDCGYSLHRVSDEDLKRLSMFAECIEGRHSFFTFKQVLNALNRDDIKSVFTSDLGEFASEVLNPSILVLDKFGELPVLFGGGG
jgi:hypothetical protein